MEKPKSLDSLFKEKIFRIPDYQRGYAWQKSQLKDFWEDLINLSDDRSHYTGVLTLKEFGDDEIKAEDNEHWLIEDHAYKMYHVVDGQQRLTTFIVFIQAFIDFVRELDDNKNKKDEEIYITESLSLKTIVSRYLFETRPTGVKYRTYKFGYTADNPSHNYLRYKIFDEDGAPFIQETFYTLNLRISRSYFCEQIKELHSKEGLSGLQRIYKKITQRFLLNEYVIQDELDVFVAFETMNNRGKKLSDLELLKNRLIYLTTLYTEKEINADERRNLRDAINDAWKEVYYQLGRNDKRPLNDDAFLQAHWIMYFQYTRQKANDYIKFLLDEKFSPQKIYAKKIEREVALDYPEENPADLETDDTENENGDAEERINEKQDRLKPDEIRRYVNSLKESAVHWFNAHYPDLATELSPREKNALDRLNRIGMRYFYPLAMSVLKNEDNPEKRTEFFDAVERFIFIVFLLCQRRRHYSDSEFYNASRQFDRGTLTLKNIRDKLEASVAPLYNGNGTLNHTSFYTYLQDKFSARGKIGFYDWHGLRYFLYEYELRLLSESRHKKVAWEDLGKTRKDKISIEHIFPQTPTESWKAAFAEIGEEKYHLYGGSLGNLLLLSRSINSSLQNDDFEDKKNPKENEAGEKIRNGYADGSHSEIEVSRYAEWTPSRIEERGLRLLNFM